jgi:hypothetical protein
MDVSTRDRCVLAAELFFSETDELALDVVFPLKYGLLVLEALLARNMIAFF